MAKIQPAYVVGAGILIAAIGLAWQAYRDTQSSEASVVTQPNQPAPPTVVIQSVPAEQPDYVASLKQMSPVKFRKHIYDFGRELRLFESSLKEDEEKQWFNQRQRMEKAKTEDEKNQIWQSEQRSSSMRYTRKAQEFQAKFRARGIAIQEALERRLEIRISGNWDGGAPLTLGSLAGPKPLADLADYLEGYARRL